ncbi:agmatinase [Virgisporangium aliadipatigenens]|uniref:agmatinase n=1 Tax=Virgisporangium aliadipatigenens TaxID=741659 RepID=UPI001EF27DFC|nr:agmatinase [Virgisporangium aliadipatigenens]
MDRVAAGDVVILGAPFDWGTSFRPGARFGPRAIRDADYLEPDGKRPHLTATVDPLTALPVVDAGDIPIVRGYIEESLQNIERYVGLVAGAGAVPIVLGGDHTITFPNATAVARAHGFGDVTVVHFDAHADTGEYSRAEMLGHGVPMRKLIDSGAVPGHRFIQVGLRGYWPPPETLRWMREQRMRSYFMDEVNERGFDAVLDEVIRLARLPGDGRPARGVFLSVDIDVVDPGMAPGTGTPEPGGLTSAQLLGAVRRLGRELNVLGADILEVAPAYDQPMNITALLAHRVVLEMTTGLAERRRATERQPAERGTPSQPMPHSSR